MGLSHKNCKPLGFPIGSMYGIYANIGGILMVNVTIYSIHGSYGILGLPIFLPVEPQPFPRSLPVNEHKRDILSEGPPSWDHRALGNQPGSKKFSNDFGFMVDILKCSENNYNTNIYWVYGRYLRNNSNNDWFISN